MFVGVKMDVVMREIEEKDYPNVLAIGNNALGGTHKLEDLTTHYARIKNDERYIVN